MMPLALPTARIPPPKVWRAILPAVAGFLMEKEIKYLGQAVANPKRPFVAILGGAKISDKIGVIKNLLAKADVILIGGGMANTFFKAQGYPVADSLVEEEALETARELLKTGSTKLRLPVDVVIADKFDAEAAEEDHPGWSGTGWLAHSGYRSQIPWKPMAK